MGNEVCGPQICGTNHREQHTHTSYLLQSTLCLQAGKMHVGVVCVARGILLGVAYTCPHNSLCQDSYFALEHSAQQQTGNLFGGSEEHAYQQAEDFAHTLHAFAKSVQTYYT